MRRLHPVACSGICESWNLAPVWSGSAQNDFLSNFLFLAAGGSLPGLHAIRPVACSEKRLHAHRKPVNPAMAQICSITNSLNLRKTLLPRCEQMCSHLRNTPDIPGI